MGFVSRLVGFGIECATAYKSTINMADFIKNKFKNLSIDEISIKDFLELYDARIYNFDSKRPDIKYLKSIDSAGIYIFHNKTSDLYYVGKATYTFKKVYRIINCYENEKIYRHINDKEQMAVRVILLKNSDCDNIEDLLSYFIEMYKEKLG